VTDGWRTWAALALLVLGLSRMAGDLLGARALQGLAAATTAAPAPTVLSAERGLETYSTRVALLWTDRAGAPQRLELTPEVHGRLRGPGSRRAVYGAALASGPVLARDPAAPPMLQAILARSLCGSRPLLAELGVDPTAIAGDVRVRYQPRPGSGVGQLPLTLAVPCP
jgi:hypothetical protein